MSSPEPISTYAPRFLILRGGALGDFIVTLPVLQALRAQWPRAEIEIWGYPHIASLAQATGLAQTVVSLDRAEMARFFVPHPDFTDAQVQAIRSFDILFNYLHDPVAQVRSNLLLAGARQVLSGCPIIKRGHAVEFLLEPLQALALYDTALVPRLDFPDAARRHARQQWRTLGLTHRPILVHPGSGSPSKNWPLDRYIEIIRRLHRDGRPVALVLGEADAPLETALLDAFPPETLPRLRQLPLPELGALMSESEAYLGNDSGITHLAAAVGLPVTALFGPSDPSVWAPRGRAPVCILRAPENELERLDISTVWEALTAPTAIADSSRLPSPIPES